MVEGMRESKRKSLGSLQEEVSGLESRIGTLSMTEKVFKHLIDRLAKADLERMDKLVTYGLSVVFPGRDIKFVSRLEEYGKRMRVALRTVDGGNEVSPDSSSSVQVIESFILRLLCMRKMKRASLMLFDETFAAVDNVNIDNVGKLITQLSDKTGMDILLVTHLPQFAEWGRHMYRISKRGKTAVLEKIR
jgi:hypothetical protein